MTLTAQSVVALRCYLCEDDLRGAPKVQFGDYYLCPTCELRRQRTGEPSTPPERDDD